MQPDRRPAGSFIDDLLKAFERGLVGLIGRNLCLKLKGIGGGEGTEGDPSVFVLGPGMPVVAVEYVGLNVSYQHAFVFPGFPGKADVQVLAEKASPSVCGYYVLSGDLVMLTVAQNGGGHGFFILVKVDELSRQFDVQSPGAEELPQQLFDAELGDDENAGIRPIGCGVAAVVYIEVAEDGRAIVTAEGEMEASVGEDLVYDSQIIEQFETAGLQALASRAGKKGRGPVDDA